jgi:hypothetical protein
MYAIANNIVLVGELREQKRKVIDMETIFGRT